MRLISFAVLVVLGLLVYSVAWTTAFGLLDSSSDLGVFVGALFIGFLIGFAIWAIIKVYKRFTTLYKE